MENIYLSFVITTISGISTLLGMIPIYFKQKNKDNIINISLSFAAGVMLSISINTLFKESYTIFNNYYSKLNTILIITIFIILGIMIVKVINHLLKKIDNKLYKLGIINTISLIIHNIPEGILTFSTSTTNISLGILLSLAIMLHNIPEGISIAIPIYYSTGSRIKAFIYTSIAGFSEVLGAFITYIFLYKYISFSFIGIMLSITIGIMSYIAIFELLPNSLKYKNIKLSIISFLVGYILMICIK